MGQVGFEHQAVALFELLGFVIHMIGDAAFKAVDEFPACVYDRGFAAVGFGFECDDERLGAITRHACTKIFHGSMCEYGTRTLAGALVNDLAV